MSDEIIEEVIETPIEETPEVPEIPEGGEVETPIEDVFNPDDLEFEESHELEGYDLSKYKDTIDLENKEVQAKAKKFKELGFTQEQVELYLEDTMQPTKETIEPTAQEVRERLAKSLTQTEKRNYKAVSSFVKDGLQGTDLEAYATEAMKNPTLVKMFNAIYSKANSAGVKTDTPVTKREVPSKTSATEDDIRNSYREWMSKTPYEEKTPENRVKFFTEIIESKSNKEELTKAFKDFLKV